MKSNRILDRSIVLLILALTVSISLNFFLFNKGLKYYQRLNLTRLDPLDLSVYPQNNKNTNSEKLRVVFFGDSRSYRWPQPPGLNQFEFINRSIRKQTSAQVVERFDEHVAPLQPDFLLIQMCINDLSLILLFPHLKSEIISNCKDNLKLSVQKARNQGATVILTTIFPLGKLSLYRSLFWSDDVGQAIEEVNQFIYSLESDKVIIFDTGKVLANDKGLVREEYSVDYIHPNEFGYEALNRKLVNILEELVQPKTVNTP